MVPLPPSSPPAEGVVRLNKKEKKSGLTYAPVALLIIALPIVVVPGVGVAAVMIPENIYLNYNS